MSALEQLAKRGRAASAFHCPNCEQPLRQEGTSVFYLCLPCERLYTLVRHSSEATCWHSKPLPMVRR